MKWVKVRNKKEWVCSVCRTCGDNMCCSTPAKWIKHPNVYSLCDISLCDKCFDGHHERLLKEFKESRKKENEE